MRNRCALNRCLLNLSALFAALLLAPALLVSAQTPEPPTFCSAYDDVHIPLADRPTEAQAKALVASQCDTIGLYYTPGPHRTEKARLCAFSQIGVLREHPESEDATVDGDFSAGTAFTLAALYVNGEGVTPDLKIARHYACLSADFSNDPDSIAASLESGKHFEPCLRDSSVSGRQTNMQCMGIRQFYADADLKRTMEQLKLKLSPSEFAALTTLRATRIAYRKAHELEKHGGNSSIVQSGMMEDLDADLDWLDLMHSALGQTPPANLSGIRALAKSDADLNSAYKSLMESSAKDCHPSDSFCTRPETLRQVQRTWLPYREAMARFGSLRWPQLPPDVWRSWLTEQRLQDMDAGL